MEDTHLTDNSPLEGRLPIADALRDIKRAHNALAAEHYKLRNEFYDHAATADTAYVGGDRRRHHDDHASEHQARRDRSEFWKKIWPQVIGGLVIAAVTLFGSAFLFFVRNGG